MPFSEPAEPIKVFISCAQEDEELSRKLVSHLARLQHEKLVTICTSYDIGAGLETEHVISQQIESVDVILLLISASYLGSPSGSRNRLNQLQRALQRYKDGNARVIPVLLRPCDSYEALLADLKPLPDSRIPVTATGSNEDQAFENIARGIRRTVNELNETHLQRKLTAYEQLFYEASRQGAPPGRMSSVRLQGQSLGLKNEDLDKVQENVFAFIEAEDRERLDQYEQKFTSVAWENYPLSQETIEELIEDGYELGLKDDELRSLSDRINRRVEDEYKFNLSQYEQRYDEATRKKHPLTPSSYSQLKEYGKTLGLKDEDLKEIEDRIYSCREKEYRRARRKRRAQSLLNGLRFIVVNVFGRLLGYLLRLLSKNWKFIAILLGFAFLAFYLQSHIFTLPDSNQLSQNKQLNQKQSHAEKPLKAVPQPIKPDQSNSKITPELAKYLVEEWLQTKGKVYSPSCNPELLKYKDFQSLITLTMYSYVKGVCSELKRANHYYKYYARATEFGHLSLISPEKGVIPVDGIGQWAICKKRGDKPSEPKYPETVTVSEKYEFELTEGKWKIAGIYRIPKTLDGTPIKAKGAPIKVMKDWNCKQPIPVKYKLPSVVGKDNSIGLR